MKRSNQPVYGAMTGSVSTDDGYRPNKHASNITWTNKGGRNATTDEAHRGAGQLAPRPQTSRQGLLSQSSATAPSQAGFARVKGVSSSGSGSAGSAGSFKPIQKPRAGVNNTAMPIQTGAAAPAPRGGPAGVRAGGRNQSWPNGAMYTDASKKGGHARGGEFQKAASRKKKGAPFFGEWLS